MIAGIPPLDLFGVRLTVESVDRKLPGAALRCEVDTHRLTAVTRIGLTARQAADLLTQVEHQYNDFGRSVSWASDNGASEIGISWTLNTNGHAQGRFELKSPYWRVEGELDGDQSYLPKLALGLRLILRALHGEPLS